MARGSPGERRGLRKVGGVVLKKTEGSVGFLGGLEGMRGGGVRVV